MKLWLKGNSIRMRLDRQDFEVLVDRGRVDDEEDAFDLVANARRRS